MCRDWRRCPSNRGERKRAYQRARYAAKKVEATHAGTTSPGGRGVDVAVAGEGDVAPDAAAGAAATRSADAVAAGYTSPEPTTAVTRLLAESAVSPAQAARRLNDPDDVLYIDPADTSDSAYTAREAVVTMLCSTDLSDTQGLDAWVSATCSREHGEKVAAAAVERAKDLHEQTDELAAIARDAEVAKAVRTTGRALSVGTGIRTSHALEDRIRERVDEAGPLVAVDLLAAVDDENARGVHAGFFEGADAATSARSLAKASATQLVRSEDTSPDKAEAAVERALQFYVDAFPEPKRIDELDFDDMKRYAEVTAASEPDDIDFEARAAVSQVFDAAIPDEYRAQYMQDWWPKVRALQTRAQDEDDGTLTKVNYGTACRAALFASYLHGSPDKVSGTPDESWAVKRYAAMNRAMPDLTPTGTDDTRKTVWFDTVRETLGEVSPRFEDTGQFDAISVKNSQARKKDIDEVKRALSLYSQRDMEKFYDDFGKDDWGRRDIEYIRVERSKKRAHFKARDYVEIDDPDSTAYLQLDRYTLENFLNKAEAEDRDGRVRLDEVGYAYVSKDKPSDVRDTAFLPKQGEEGYEARRQRMQELVDRYNALPEEDRRDMVGRRRKSGHRLMVDTTEVEVFGENGKEVKTVAFIRTTAKLPSSTSKTTATVSTVRVNEWADTTHHEVAHMVDHYVAPNNDIAQEFLRERIDGLDEVHYRAGKPDEKVVADSFYNEYVGKTSYGTRASEVNSMGVEVLMHSPYQAREIDTLPKRDGKTVVSCAPTLIDPEHHDHTLGLLAGTPRTLTYNGANEDRSDHNDRVMRFLKRTNGGGEFADRATVYVPMFEDDGTLKETSGMMMTPLHSLREMAKTQPDAQHSLEWLRERYGDAV